MKENVLMWDVDTQRDFMERTGKWYAHGADEIFGNLRIITDVAKKRQYKMAGSVDAHVKNDPEFETYPEHCVIGTEGQKKVDATRLEGTLFIDRPRMKDEYIAKAVAYNGPVIFEKNMPDCRVNENIAPFLAEANPDEIVIYGILTDICVDLAVKYIAGDLGYKVCVVEDAIKELDPIAAERCKANWKKLGVELMKTVEIV